MDLPGRPPRLEARANLAVAVTLEISPAILLNLNLTIGLNLDLNFHQPLHLREVTNDITNSDVFPSLPSPSLLKITCTDLRSVLLHNEARALQQRSRQPAPVASFRCHSLEDTPSHRARDRHPYCPRNSHIAIHIPSVPPLDAPTSRQTVVRDTHSQVVEGEARLSRWAKLPRPCRLSIRRPW